MKALCNDYDCTAQYTKHFWNYYQHLPKRLEPPVTTVTTVDKQISITTTLEIVLHRAVSRNKATYKICHGKNFSQ